MKGRIMVESTELTYDTAHILKKYNITRQTLNNWINSGLISIPEKDWRGWKIWTEELINEIETVILDKKNKRNNAKKSNFTQNEQLHINNRRYLGSKHKLISFIKDVVKNECTDIETFTDIFGGTGVVGNAFNGKKVKIIMNDILYSNFLSYHTWFSNESYDMNKVKKLIKDFNQLSTEESNYVSKNFGDKYFTLKNAKKIGAIREEIEMLTPTLTFREKAILITSLLYGMDKVANTCGHYDAYRQTLDTTQSLRLLVPVINDSVNINNEIYREDANLLARKISSDIVYIDTPYNSRQYSDAYHLLENIAEWKQPPVTGVAKKMIDRNHIKSRYCTIKAPEAFDDLITNLRTRYILVSYNNMGKKGNGRSNAKIEDEEILEILSKKGQVKIYDTDFQYFTTGKTILRNHKERLFLCKCK